MVRAKVKLMEEAEVIEESENELRTQVVKAIEMVVL